MQAQTNTEGQTQTNSPVPAQASVQVQAQANAQVQAQMNAQVQIHTEAQVQASPTEPSCSASIPTRAQGALPAPTPVLQGLRDAGPIVLAYVPLGAGFGLLARVIGMPTWLVALTSLLLYAGAGQYTIASMLAAGVSLPIITASVILLNLRHLLYSASIGMRLDRWPALLRWLGVFGLTDEVYAVASMAPGPFAPQYYFALAIASHLAWIGGSVSGAWLGGLLPSSVTNALAYSLTALFLALLLGTGQPHQLRTRLVAAGVAGGVTLGIQLAGGTNVGLLLGALAGTTAGWWCSQDRRRGSRDDGPDSGLGADGSADPGAGPDDGLRTG
ncbi:MAG: AzlC family ABC transporter permease [Limnochordaceae bacterium]|nr:AzlC family ABC transporter permease [Limnochordaceae bacterium]